MDTRWMRELQRSWFDCSFRNFSGTYFSRLGPENEDGLISAATFWCARSTHAIEHSALRWCCPVVKELHHVIAEQHVLRTCDELSVDSAGVVREAVLTIVPVGNEDHHVPAFFDENRVIDQTRNVADMLLHLCDKFVCHFIGYGFGHDHSSCGHNSSP